MITMTNIEARGEEHLRARRIHGQCKAPVQVHAGGRAVAIGLGAAARHGADDAGGDIDAAHRVSIARVAVMEEEHIARRVGRHLLGRIQLSCRGRSTVP